MDVMRWRSGRWWSGGGGEVVVEEQEEVVEGEGGLWRSREEVE